MGHCDKVQVCVCVWWHQDKHSDKISRRRRGQLWPRTSHSASEASPAWLSPLQNIWAALLAEGSQDNTCRAPPMNLSEWHSVIEGKLQTTHSVAVDGEDLYLFCIVTLRFIIVHHHRTLMWAACRNDCVKMTNGTVDTWKAWLAWCDMHTIKLCWGVSLSTSLSAHSFMNWRISPALRNVIIITMMGSLQHQKRLDG